MARADGRVPVTEHLRELRNRVVKIALAVLVGSALVEAAEVLIYFNDKRYARNHPDLYSDLADDELAPIEADEDRALSGSGRRED